MTPDEITEAARDLTVSPIRRSPPGPFVTSSNYHWTVQHDDPDLGPTVTCYRTSSRGDGLWIDGGEGSLDRQVAGTCDFDIGEVAPSTRRRRVIREMVLRHAYY